MTIGEALVTLREREKALKKAVTANKEKISAFQRVNLGKSRRVRYNSDIQMDNWRLDYWQQQLNELQRVIAFLEGKLPGKEFINTIPGGL